MEEDIDTRKINNSFLRDHSYATEGECARACSAFQCTTRALPFIAWQHRAALPLLHCNDPITPLLAPHTAIHYHPHKSLGFPAADACRNLTLHLLKSNSALIDERRPPLHL